VKEPATNEPDVQHVHGVHDVQNMNSVNELEPIGIRDEDSNDLFTGRSMNDWLSLAASKPVPMRLFGDFWSEGELSILFADTASGKSALAMQIAQSICAGKPTPGFAMEATPQGVLYFDFELTEMQLRRRYAVENRDRDRIWFDDYFDFHPTLRRFEINNAARLFDQYEDWETLLIEQIETAVLGSGEHIIVFDNLTYLSRETEKGKFAIPLMQRLNDLKKNHSLSLLILAHTPKRDESRPITVNDLAGSKSIANFADSVFAIGKSSRDSNLRYLKQIKARNTEIVYDDQNVAVCRFEKPHNLLRFEFVGCQDENEHLAPLTKSKRLDLMARARSLSAEGLTQREIATELGIGLGTVNKYLKH